MTPAQSLQTAFLPAAQMLNYGWVNHLASIDKGKYADIIAVSGNPLQDVTEMERVRFVMKNGLVYRDQLTSAAPAPATR
jgi:imidazolonepropionase-like amidohydrolase